MNGSPGSSHKLTELQSKTTKIVSAALDELRLQLHENSRLLPNETVSYESAFTDFFHELFDCLVLP